MTGGRRRSRGRGLAVGAVAAVAVFVVVAGVVLGWDATHPPRQAGRPATAAPARPTASPPLPAPAAAALLHASAAALRSTPTAHVVGVVGGAPGAVRVDLAVSRTAGAQGTLVVAGVPVDVVRAGGRTYVRSRQLVSDIAGGTVASYVGDRWLVLGANLLGVKGIGRALDRATSLDGIASLVDASAAQAQGGTHTAVTGRPVIEVVSGTTVVDVAAGGTPYPVRVTLGEGTSLTLDRFGVPVAVVTPTHGVVDLGRLPGIG